MGQIITFGPSSIRARRRKPRSMFYDQAVSSNPAAKLLKEALVWFQPSGIEDTSGNVTAWRNSGTGGSSYDLTTVSGAVTIDTFNGRSVVRTNGATGTYLRTAAPITTPQPYTVMSVFKFDSKIPTTGGGNYIYDGHIASGSLRSFFRWENNTTTFEAYAGSFLGLTTGNSTADIQPHAMLAVFNGVSSTLFLDETKFIGNPGSAELSALTIAHHNATDTTTQVAGLNGWTGEYLMIPRVLSDSEALLLINRTESVWGL